MFSRLRNMRIRNKILLYFYGMVAVAVVGVSIYYQYENNKNILAAVSTKHEAIVRQLVTDVAFHQNDISEIATYLSIDSAVLAFLKEDGNRSFDEFYSDTSLSFIYRLIASKSHISALTIYGKTEKPLFYVYTDLSNGSNTLSHIQKQSFYSESLSAKGAPVWHMMKAQDDTIILNNLYDKISLSKAIVDPTDEVDFYKGFMTITFNTTLLDDSLEKIVDMEYEAIVIYDSAGEEIYHYGDVAVLGGNFDALIGSFNNTNENTVVTRENIISRSTLDKTDWTAFYLSDRQYFTKNTVGNSTMWLFVFAVCVAVTLPVSLMFSTYLNRPIRRLLESMKRFENGEFDEEVPIEMKDEIGELSEGYNRMVKNIRALINEVYILEIKEQEAELKALQAQMNPHFLYNSLDTIYWKSLSGRGEGISEMIYALSRIFRISLNRGEDLIRVASEIELVEHYLALQKMRFKDKLTYDIKVVEDMKECMIPKLIIQPFVENAVIHGIEPLENGGHVSIIATIENDALLFVVEDNGVGYRDDNHEGLDLKEGMHKSGYALKNIKERLELTYGQNYEMSISNVDSQGTMVRLQIPMEKGDDMDVQIDADR